MSNLSEKSALEHEKAESSGGDGLPKDEDGFPFPPDSRLTERFRAAYDRKVAGRGGGRLLQPPGMSFGPKYAQTRDEAISSPQVTAGAQQSRFIQLMEGNKNITSLSGSNKPLTREEVAKHCTPEDAWTVLDRKVYNITPYLQFHPGGKQILVKTALGKDSTEAFRKYHPWVNYELLLKDLYLGPLVD